MTTVPKKRKFTTDIPCEIMEMTWEVKNFAQLVSVKENLESEEITQMTFSAGDDLGLPTQWKFFLVKSDDKVAIRMKLLKAPKEQKNIFANFQCATSTITAGEQHFGARPTKVNDFNLKLNVHSEINLGLLSTIKETVSRFVNGDLTLRIRFILYNVSEITAEETEAKQRKLYKETPIGEDLGKLLDSGERTDVTFKLMDGKTLKAHATILLARSPVLAAMFQTQMTESLTGIVKIEDLSYETMSTVLKFIYTGKPNLNWEKNIEEVIYAAEKYQLPLLKELCDNTLGDTCKLANAFDLLRIAELHVLKVAEKTIIHYIETNIKEIIPATKSQRLLRNF